MKQFKIHIFQAKEKSLSQNKGKNGLEEKWPDRQVLIFNVILSMTDQYAPQLKDITLFLVPEWISKHASVLCLEG